MILALVIFAVIFITFLLFVILYIYPSTARDTSVPGPPASSSSDGNLSDLEMAGGLGEYLRELHAQYGPLVSFHLGKQLLVSLGTAALIEEHSSAAERPLLYLEFARPLLGRESIVWADRAETTRRWRLYQQGFSEECRTVYRQAAREAAGRVAGKLGSLCPDEHVSVQQYASALALHIVARCCFGHHMDDEASMLSFAQEYEIVTAEVTSEACGRRLYESQQDHLLEAAAALRDVVAGIVRQHRRENKSTVSLVEWVALSARGGQAGGDSDAPVSDLLALFMFLCETVSSGLCWTLYQLSKHQLVQDMVVAQLTGERTDDGLVDRVVRECWRLGSVVPFTMRQHSSPSAAGGHVLPANTPLISAFCVSNTAEGWLKPDRFDPARFESEDAPALDTNPLPFLSRHDNAEGASSLYREVVTEVLRVLLPVAQLELLPDQSREQLITFVTTPREDVWVTVSPRSAAA